MSPDPARIESLVAAALEKSPEARATFLVEACGGDEGLLRRVEALVRAHEAIAHLFGRDEYLVLSGGGMKA